MNLAKRLKQLTTLTTLSGLLIPAAYAHPGHDTANILHGVLHTEHLMILLAIGVVIAIRYFIKE